MFEKIVEFSPAFDRRDPDPTKNYGIHGVELRMVLKGDKGAVQFVLYTNWQLEHVEKELESRGSTLLNKPLPADLGYHSKVPQYEEQSPMKDCQYTGGDCYYDGSGLAAERVFNTLRKKGSDGVWEELEGYYNQVFEEIK